MRMTWWMKALQRRVVIPVLSRTRPEVQVRVQDFQMKVDLRDEIVGTLLYVEGDYEPEFRRLLEHLEVEGGVCLDIGANIGLHTLTLSRRVGPRGKVISFEPEQHNHELLRENLRLNHAENVDARHMAVGNRMGSVRMALHPYNYGDHRVAGEGTGGTGQEVPLTTVDEAVKDIPAGEIRLVKIDVQGYEHNVLQGMRRTVERNPGMVLLVEVFPEALLQAGSSASKLVQALVDMGFDGWEIHQRRLIPLGKPWVYDHMWNSCEANLVLSRDTERLKQVVGASFGRTLP
ncbi:FkbM family methyltransferase [Archangium violaceum]|uniref:FkbM family methyltransferase n=1 Tax=Archangium violaceum TaxID=83451 RepID=UPI002B2E5EDF|nr:FkbM family methyltransferase [Archangium gephyra]